MRTLKIFASLLLVVVLQACQSKADTAAVVAHINGYWEIEKAQLPDGTEKDYTINSTIDYFELKEDQTGVRYKVVPQFNGEYLTNDRPESFVLTEKEGALWLVYKTDFATWEEQVLSITDEKMVVENETKIKYYYKRANPVQIKE
ncbi:MULTISPECIES: lipocalin family protein [unclassified Myroides]|uniref:lipocalin family protein n=1 Tax=unclassified Myroides TaxID=2642485 RepID=UPI003D2F558D